MSIDDRIESVRRFTRFYTRQLRLLDDGILESPYRLTEARVIYELAHRDDLTSTALARDLGLDLGYMSRTVRGLQRKGLVTRRRDPNDRRHQLLQLTARGRRAFDRLNRGSMDQIREMLSDVSVPQQRDMVDAMNTIRRTLAPDDDQPVHPPYSLRPHRPGDIGWMIERHGALYQASHNWGTGFEAMCAEVGAQFLSKYDPQWERSWIAERGGRRVGAVLLVRRSKTVGQLRFLFVEPDARGLGLGARLVSECVGHARHVGYRKMTLFTVRGLDAARRLYEAEGFTLAQEEPGTGWAEGAMYQQWNLTL